MLTSSDFKEHCQFTRPQIHGVFNLNRGFAKPSPKRNIFMIQLFYLLHSLGVVSFPSSASLCAAEKPNTMTGKPENILNGSGITLRNELEKQRKQRFIFHSIMCDMKKEYYKNS